MSNAINQPGWENDGTNHPYPNDGSNAGWFWGWNPTGSSDDLELARALLAFELLCKAKIGQRRLRSDLRR